MMPSAALFELVTSHAYRGGAIEPDIGFVPSPATGQLLTAHGLAARSDNGSLKVARFNDRKPWFDDRPHGPLIFAVTARRDEVFHYTELPIDSPGRGCAPAKPVVAQKKFAIGRTRAHAAFGNLAGWLAGLRAFLALIIPTGLLESNSRWTLPLAARRVHWRYHVLSNTRELQPANRMLIDGTPDGLSFKPLDPDRRDLAEAETLESDTPWPLSEQGLKSARLLIERQGRDPKILFSGLPAPSPLSLRMVHDDPTPRADAFLYV
ncbi:hypothetical protein [Pseudokordiimonas caeni]|uniref:hypothetical protein n=1 Tax=Pseudokordiimonas caeni TaxID=2997908 RepID=UPI0028126339|nr:hypothetical protein [Pseudokordiimonas caeni]